LLLDRLQGAEEQAAGPPEPKPSGSLPNTARDADAAGWSSPVCDGEIVAVGRWPALRLCTGYEWVGFFDAGV
jgi:hypothetical protein